MTILEFIEEQYPIKDRVEDKLSDPYRKILESDDFPYDKIGPDEFGVPTKLIEIEEGYYMPVLELISMTREDALALDDKYFFSVWEDYMKNIDIQAVNIIDIMECVRAYKENKIRREEQANVLSVQKK